MITLGFVRDFRNIEQDPSHLAAGSVGRGTRRFAFGTPWRTGRSSGTQCDDVVGTAPSIGIQTWLEH